PAPRLRALGSARRVRRHPGLALHLLGSGGRLLVAPRPKGAELPVLSAPGVPPDRPSRPPGVRTAARPSRLRRRRPARVWLLGARADRARDEGPPGRG